MRSNKYPSAEEDWKKFEKNNVKIALKVFYMKKEKIYPAYVSRNNSNCEKQVILLMIPNGEIRRCYSLEVKIIDIIKRHNIKK